MRRIVLVSFLLAGCTGATGVVEENPAVLQGRPVDATSRKVMSALGDRVDLAKGQPPAGIRAATLGGWSYEVQAPINGGAALWTSSASTGTCSDVIFVPVNSGDVFNLYALTNLYASCPQGVERLTPARCDPTIGHCPTLKWVDGLAGGAFDGNSVVTSLDGSALYVASAGGHVYKIGAADGSVKRDFNANTELMLTDATFVNSTPWVNYASGSVYVALSANKGKAGRLLKLDADVKLLASIELPDGVTSSPIEYGGFVYVATLGGKVYKIEDKPTSLTLAPSPWPIDVQNNQAVLDSPSIDADNNLLFISAGDRLAMVGLNGNVKDRFKVSAGAGVNSSASSPALDLDSHAAFIGHEGKLWRINYSTGGFGTALKEKTRGSGTNSDDPRSSPLVFRSSQTSLLYAYIGDGGGFLNRYDADTLSNRAVFPSQAMGSGIGGPIDGSIFIDYLGGNLYFGGGVGATKIFQVTQIAGVN